MIPTALVAIIPSVLIGLEKMFGPKTGQTKKQVAIDVLRPLVEQLATAGKMEPITKDALSNLIETVLQEMKAEGTLPEADKPRPAARPTVSITLPAGSTITLSQAVQVNL